ncbi:MAG: hypothetical protein HP490_00655 [Nitrospira sp.]|nr:hypothetical protein [Nitrospira sp.]MBH0184236.1 hypothetical protein [Nitrospira sp.]
MDQESLAQIQQIVGAATEALRTDIAGVKRHTDVVTETLRADIADAKRHTGVLTEGLRHELQLVAEGFQMHLDRRHADDREHLDNQFKETRALIQLSYGQIQERVERLEQRVRTIEQHLGLTV